MLIIEEWFSHVKTSRFLTNLLELSSRPAAGIRPDAHFSALCASCRDRFHQGPMQAWNMASLIALS
jgi:hypothetical protein